MDGYLLDTHALIFIKILLKVGSGENVVITHNKKKVAYIKPVKKKEWRKLNRQKPKLLVSPDELIKPVEDIWKDYI